MHKIPYVVIKLEYLGNNSTPKMFLTFIKYMTSARLEFIFFAQQKFTFLFIIYLVLRKILYKVESKKCLQIVDYTRSTFFKIKRKFITAFIAGFSIVLLIFS